MQTEFEAAERRSGWPVSMADITSNAGALLLG
jgi:hypothetical protein